MNKKVLRYRLMKTGSDDDDVTKLYACDEVVFSSSHKSIFSKQIKRILALLYTDSASSKLMY